MEHKEPRRKKTGGRQKGTPNKTTAQIKEMIVSLVGTQMEKWPLELEKMMRKDPAEAMKITGRLIDYVLPKQTKMELEGELKTKIESITININHTGSESTNRNNDNIPQS